MNDLAFTIVHDFLTAGFEFAASGNLATNIPDTLQVGRLRSDFPRNITAGQSLALTFCLFNDQAKNIEKNCAGATCTLYARPQDSGIAQTTLGTTTSITGSGNNIFTITVPYARIADAWSLYSTEFVLEVLKSGANQADYVHQAVTIISTLTTAEDLTTKTKDIPISVATLTSETTLENVPGFRLFFLDASGGTFPVHLPAPGTYEGQSLFFRHIEGSNQVDIDPGTYELEGDTADVPMSSGHGLRLVEYHPDAGDASWMEFESMGLAAP